MSLPTETTPEIFEYVAGHPDRFAQIRLRFKNGREQTFVFKGDSPNFLEKLHELMDSGIGSIVSQAAGHEIPDDPEIV